MGAQALVAVEVHRHRVVVGAVLLAVDDHRAGVLHRVGGIVVLRELGREHPHEGAALLHVRIGVVEVDIVAVERVQVGIASRDALGVRHVVDALQVGDLRRVGVGGHEQPQRVLAVDLQLAHHEIGHEVVVVGDALRVVAHDLPVELRVLVVEVGDEGVALLREAESRAHGVGLVAALVGVRQRAVGLQPGDVEVVVGGDVGALVPLRIGEREAVLEAHLRMLGHRLGVGGVGAQRVARRGGDRLQVAQVGVAGGIPRADERSRARTRGLQTHLIRPRAGVVLAVAVAAVGVDGDRAARLAQLGAVDGRKAQVVAVVRRLVIVVGAAVTALTELPALGGAPGVVGLVAERGADHQVLVLGDLPLDACVGAVVIGPRVGVADRREGVGHHGRLVPLVDRLRVAGVGVVKEVAALHRHLVALAPRVGEVHAEGVDARHAALRAHHILAHAARTAAAPAATRDIEDVLEREVLLVDVVEQADERDARVALKDVDVAAGDVFVLRLGLRVGVVTVTGVELAELPLAHVGVGDDVDGLITLAVVHARELGGVRELVVDLHAVDGLRRQRLDGRGHVLAEELLAVDKDLLDLLALRLHRAVGHGDAGHLLEQPLHVGVAGHLEGPGVVAHRVTLLRGAQLGLLDHRFDPQALLELQGAQVEFRCSDAELRFVGLVAQEADLQRIVAVGERRYRKGARIGRQQLLGFVGSFGRGDRHHGAGDPLPGTRIDDLGREGSALLRENRRRKERDEEGQQCLSHLIYLTWV